MVQIKLITWDIEGTLIGSKDLKTTTADKVVRSNCLELMREEPVLPLMPRVEELMIVARALSIYQGIASAYAYQFANNYLTASRAREYIDPRLIILANKFAWEGHVLEGKDWDDVLKPYLKPAPTMLNLARNTLEKILAKEIKPGDCIHIGDQKHDEQAARNAGWNFYYIQKINELLLKLHANQI